MGRSRIARAVEHRGKRVLTLAQIDKAHGRPEGTAGRQFRKNRSRFELDRDYFTVGADEFRRHLNRDGISKFRGGDILLLTERGYGKVCKGWNDDRSWALHSAMQDVYFPGPRKNASRSCSSVTY